MSYTNGLDKPSDYFEAVTYTGNGLNDRAVNTTESFAPGFVWCKSRSVAGGQHFLGDSVRGDGKLLSSESTAAEINAPGNGVTSTGAIWGDGVGVNGNNETYVNWFWKAGTSFTNDASATGIGSIDSTGSVNTDAGFSIVSYTGNQTSGATVAHGLGSKPAMMIFKERNGTTSWVVYHHKNTSAPATEYLQLNSSNATGDYAGYFNDTEPTSSVFTLGNDTGINQSGDTYIAYCFAEKQGYSKFGSYTGNGNADGTFVYTGFKPAFVMVKATSISGKSWMMFDNKRIGYNQANYTMVANGSDVEDTTAGRYDILSNGFKLRNSGSAQNGSGISYIYMAFAENPFVSSTGVCATAR